MSLVMGLRLLLLLSVSLSAALCGALPLESLRATLTGRTDLVIDPSAHVRAAASMPDAAVLLERLNAALAQGAADAASVTHIRELALALAHRIDADTARQLTARPDTIESLFVLSALKDPLASELMVAVIEECLIHTDAHENFAEWVEILEDFLGDPNPAIQVRALRMLSALAKDMGVRTTLVGQKGRGLRRIIDHLTDGTAQVAVPHIFPEDPATIVIVRVPVHEGEAALRLLGQLTAQDAPRGTFGDPAILATGRAALETLSRDPGVSAASRLLADEIAASWPRPKRSLLNFGPWQTHITMAMSCCGVLLVLVRRCKTAAKRRPSASSREGRTVRKAR